jgi:hypothetical protein
VNELFAQMQFATINASTLGVNEIIPAVPGKRIRVMTYFLYASGGTNLTTWKSGTTALCGPIDWQAKAGMIFPSDLGAMQTGVNQALNLDLGTAAQVSGHVGYILVG